ncbi:hypothetical protein WN944_001863 [Citrus x changshan-huyou]|uniref:(+)-delta-cadinene synthase n=1 Tax=Citrus x changshan-huyou TaxID=2935761 RepID=A0AAP0MFG0_9ROSI
MALQDSEVPASILNATGGNRPTASYHPTLWGEKFLDCSSADDSVAMDPTIDQDEFEGLKQKIKNMLNSPTDKSFQKLSLIDAVQRLGVAYHFEREIEDELEKLSHDEYDGNDVHTVALRFRLLRQQGYRISCDIFSGFKDDQGKFKVSLINDVTGMLSLYEAAHLRIHGDDILDDALAFTTSHLESMVTQVSPQLSDEILHALNRPIRRGLPRLEAIYYIDLYSQDDSKDKEILLKFAKLDFCMLQVIHRKELSIITEWWKNLDVEINLPYARNRVVECYFWAMGVYFEPRYSFARKILSKVIAMASILDDTYDAYGTLEELELFTNAIKRWDISSIDVLPKYMKLIYQGLLDVFGEAEEEISKEGQTYCMSYVIQAVKKVVQAYFEEAKWCSEGYFPKVEEYMQVSLVTTCYHMLATASFLGMGKIADEQAFEWISNYPKIVKASQVICRLMDDIVSHEFEQKRKHVASGIECYMKQHGVSDEEVIKVFRKEISNGWKDINEGFLKPTEVAMPLLERILNLARVMDVIYKDDDGYTNSYVIKDYITTLLEKPVPF